MHENIYGHELQQNVYFNSNLKYMGIIFSAQKYCYCTSIGVRNIIIL